MQINLPYGRGTLPLDIEKGRLTAVLESHLGTAPTLDGPAAVAKALACPIGCPPLAALARGKRNIVILISDHTRPVPSRILLPPMLDALRSASPEARITLLVATGCHRQTSQQELREKLGEDILSQVEVVIHDCEDTASLIDAGTLPSGGRLLVNRLAVEADLLLSEGFIEPHFFAGFSGGRKSVLPGIASRVTVHANHCSAFIASPYARTGCLEGNPIHRDMEYAAKAVGLAFILNVVLNAQKGIAAVFAGDPILAHRAGCDYVSDACRVPARMADIVITTNGGYPLDQNIYQAVKGMTAAEATCRPGGVIIMVAACQDGHGGEGFLQTFSSPTSTQQLMDGFLATPMEETVADQWQSQIFARILLKHTVILVSQAPDDMVSALRMVPAHSLSDALAKAEAIVGHAAGITVIPDGVSTIIAPDPGMGPKA
nr:nickel-dependent lactate racemase [bacterium]